jgi:hypothetical protein
MYSSKHQHDYCPRQDFEALSAIKEKLCAPPAVPLQPSTDTHSPPLALAHSTHEKLLSSRALEKVSVKVIEIPKQSLISGRLV